MEDIKDEGLVSLDDGDFEVAEGEPDVRGWDVMSADRQRLGEVDDLLADPQAQKVRYLTIDLDTDAVASIDGGHIVRVPISRARLYERDKQVVLDIDAAQVGSLQSSSPGAIRGRSTGTDEDSAARMTRAEEEMRVGTRRVQAGEVEVTKRVETERVSEPVTLEREEAVVERRPVTGAARSDVQIGDQEIRVPITEEEAVVETRPVVKEEIVIKKRPTQTQQTVQADVRKERVDVERHEGVREHGSVDRRR